jgi:DNA-binding transcriptional ArsR family regulator
MCDFSGRSKTHESGPTMTPSTVDQQLDQRLIKALGHPLRQRLLILLHTEGEASPSELAALCGEPLGNVSYHIKILVESDCVELVRTQPVRGAVEHFYRATARPLLDDGQWEQLPLTVRRAVFGQTLHDIWQDVRAASTASGFDDPHAHASRTWLELDEVAWNELVVLLNSALDRGFELHAESAARAASANGDGERRRVAMGLLLFERALD